MKLVVVGILYTVALLAGGFGVSVAVTEWRGPDVEQAEVDQAVQRALDEQWDMFEIATKVEFLSEATDLVRQVKTGDILLRLCVETSWDALMSRKLSGDFEALLKDCKDLADAAEKAIAEE